MTAESKYESVETKIVTNFPDLWQIGSLWAFSHQFLFKHNLKLFLTEIARNTQCWPSVDNNYRRPTQLGLQLVEKDVAVRT